MQGMLSSLKTHQASFDTRMRLNLERCLIDVSAETTSDSILTHRAAAKKVAVELVAYLFADRSLPSVLVFDCLLGPSICLGEGFSHTAGPLVAQHLSSLNSVLKYTLDEYDDHPMMNHLALLMLGGGTVILGRCLSLPGEEVVTRAKELLELGLIQRLCCLICVRIQKKSCCAETLTTCFVIMLSIWNMLDCLRYFHRTALVRKLVGPCTIRACRMLLCESEQDVHSQRTVASLMLLMIHAASYEGPADSPSLQAHLKKAPAMGKAEFIEVLARVAHGPYAPATMVSADLVAHSWPAALKAGDEQSSSFGISFLGMIYHVIAANLKKHRVPGAGTSTGTRAGSTARGVRGRGRAGEPPLNLTEFQLMEVQQMQEPSNFRFQTISALNMTLYQVSKIASAPVSGSVSWSLSKLRMALQAWNVPISGMEALLRFSYRNTTPIHPSLSLFLEIMSSPGLFSRASLPGITSLAVSVRKLVFFNPQLNIDGKWGAGVIPYRHSAGMSEKTIAVCLAGMQMLQGSQLAQQLPWFVVELTATLGALLAHACDGISSLDLVGVKAAVAALESVKGVQDVVLLLLDSSEVPQGVAWNNFAASLGRCPASRKCGSQHCVNLDTCAESALPTKLCTGCRQVRYCSVECQKFAWAHGGHSQVCMT